MTVAPAAFVAAASAGIVTAALTVHALRGGSRAAAAFAAITRGIAVALAVIAAFGPVLRTTTRVAGHTLVATPHGNDAAHGEATRHWPDDAPDAAAAVETLRAARDVSSPADLVLVADGDIGRGSDVSPAARALRDGHDLRRFVVPLPDGDAPPPPLGPAPRVSAPAGATEGVPVALTIDSGSEPLGAELALVEIDRRPTTVVIADGARRVSTPPLQLTAGTHLVVAEVAGRLPAASIVDVAGPPRVLVVSAGTGPSELVTMLRTQGLDVADVRAADVRTEDVDQCAAIVLGPGVAGDSLCAAVAARVRRGAGLVVLGGEGRSGLSRFLGTAIDPLLPVVPPPIPVPPPEPPAPPPPEKKPDPAQPKTALDEGEKEALRVALLLIIDTSGSMAGTKIYMAKQSAMAAARSLSPSDRIAVIAFTDTARIVAPFQDAVDLNVLKDKIDRLPVGGLTNYFPALRVAYQEIRKQPCGIRHIVLITDGDSQQGTYGDVIQGAKDLITISAIAVDAGEDAERELAIMTNFGHGKKYAANDPQRLPEVVTLDTQRFATDKRDKLKKERPKIDAEDLPTPPADAPPVDRGPGPPEPKPPEAPVTRRPHVATPATFLAGVENETWPPLPFAETTPARPASQVVLAWDDESPALTIGRAGLGRVAVISAGAASPQAAEFLHWQAAPQFLAQLVRGLVEPPPPGAEAAAAEFVETNDGRAFVTVGVPGGGEIDIDPLKSGGKIAARCADRGSCSIAELAAMPAAGVYAGTFTVHGAPPRRVVAVSAGPAPVAPGTARRIAAASGAEIVDAPPAPRDGVPVEHDEPRELELVAAAAGLLVVEAALRRVARRVA